MMIMVDSGPPPRPPASSENGAPSRPSSANASHRLRLQPSSLATILRRASKSYWSRNRRWTLDRSSSCSSVNWISIRFSLEAEHGFGDDVALDLVGSAVDAELARVQVFFRRGVTVVRSRHKMIGADRMLADRQAVIADRAMRQFGDVLEDL